MPGRRWAPLVLFLLAVPAVARAQHFDGDAGTGAFDPALAVQVANPVAGQASDLVVRLTQPDHQDPAVLIDVRIPGAWQFDVTLPPLRRGEAAGGAPATTCAQTVTGLGDGMNANARFARAERVGSSSLLAHADGISRIGAPGQPAGPEDTPIAFEGQHAFLSWDAGTQTAQMCLLLLSDDARLSALPPPAIESTTEVLEQYQLRKVGSTWQALIDIRDLAKDPDLQAVNASAIDFTNGYRSATVGNWNPAPAPFARNAPATGVYTFSATFETCPPADPTFANCKSNRAPVTRTVPIELKLPGVGLHPVPELLQPQPFQVLTGSRILTVRWEEDRGAEIPKGYVLTLARPGEFRPDFVYRARYASGTTGYPCGTDDLCSVQLVFPLQTASGARMSPNEKYAVSIVAIFDDGHRSDGRCDDGTPLGTLVGCSAAITHAPGWSSAEFLLREDLWPVRYQDIITPYQGRVDNPATRDVLLIDPGLGKVEYVAWNPGAPAVTFAAADPRLSGQTTSGTFAVMKPHTDPLQTYWITGFWRPSEAIAVLVHPTRNLVVPDHPGPSTPRVPAVQTPVNAPQPRLLFGSPA